MKEALSTLFFPQSIAVVGASREPNKVGGIVLSNIISGKFKGKIYPVNPVGGKIQRLTAYQKYAEIPAVPDVAVVVVPAAAVPYVLKEIGAKGTKHVIIVSAGFKEVGGAGEQLEEEIKDIAKHFRLSIVGPNCLGVVSSGAKLNATFGQANLTNGNVRFISQSGAIATSIFDYAAQSGVGFSEFITFGNKAGVTENDVLAYFAAQKPFTSAQARVERSKGYSGYQPVGVYLESIANGQTFLSLARAMGEHSPVFMVKPGKSSGAQKAMLSHTGSIAGDDDVLNVALAEAGVIRCHGLEDLFDMTKAAAWEKAPDGPNVAVVSNAGGPAVISADLVAENGLSFAPLSAHTHHVLQDTLPAAANIHNPIDVLGDALASRYKDAIETVLAEKSVDALVVLLTPQVTTQIRETAEIIVSASLRYNKPIYCSFIGGRQVATGEAILNEHKIPCFRYPERAIWALSKMWQWQNWRQHQVSGNAKTILALTSTQQRAAEHVLKQAHGKPALSPVQANELLKTVGVTVPHGATALSTVEAENFLKHFKTMVLKVSAASLLHKSDTHGVIQNIETKVQLERAWKELRKIVAPLSHRDTTARIMMQEQIKNGFELIVGVKTDPQFGKVLLVSAGGILVELLKEKNLHTLPISKTEIEKLVAKSAVHKILSGYRGHRRLAVAKLYDTIAKVAALAMMPHIAEIEINPLIVTAENAYAVDGRVILHYAPHHH